MKPISGTVLKPETLKEVQGGVLYCNVCPQFGSAACKACRDRVKTSEPGSLR